MDGQVTLSDLGIWCGKMSPEPSPQTAAKTSKSSSRRSSASSSRRPPMCLCLVTDGPRQDASTTRWEDGHLLGEYTTPSFGECPSDAVESRLSWILEVSPHPKYCLSADACLGVLNRSKRRGKPLDPTLEEALLYQAEHYPEIYRAAEIAWMQSHSESAVDVRGGAKDL